MKNHDPHIEFLLELFMQGETSLEQERELSRYFANSNSIPEQWKAFRDMFAYFDAGMPIKEEKPKRNVVSPLWAMLAAAAIAAITLMVAPLLHHTPTTKPTTAQPHIAVKNNDNTQPADTIVNPQQLASSHLVAKQEHKPTIDKPQVANRHSTLDSVDIEREQGEVEQAQQELMADMFIIEQERQDIINEQHNSRAQTYQAQQAAQNETPQFIQVVFK